jgi:hypothetical protein
VEEYIKITQEVAAANRTFTPVGRNWQQSQCIRLQLKIREHLHPMDIDEPLRAPTAIEQIDGDGNCFYRVIAVHLTGREADFRKVKFQLVKWINLNPKVLVRIEDMEGASYNPILNIETSRKWATECEIYIAAAWLQTDIYVYTRMDGKANKDWHVFKAAILGERKNAANIYINHPERVHYERVIRVNGPMNKSKGDFKRESIEDQERRHPRQDRSPEGSTLQKRQDHLLRVKEMSNSGQEGSGEDLFNPSSGHPGKDMFTQVQAKSRARKMAQETGGWRDRRRD